MSREKLSGQRLDSDGIAIVQMEAKDAEAYYKAGFEHPEPEVDYYTGSEGYYTFEEIRAYIEKVAVADNRYDFLVMDGARLIGEIVLKDIERESGSSSMRVALFNRNDFGQGKGSRAVMLLQRFAFEVLGLSRIELEVYSHNLRGYRAYLGRGFVEEGRSLQDTRIGDETVDTIRMAISRDSYLARKA